LGFGFVSTIKIILGGSLVLSALFSFFWLRKMFGEKAALIGSLFYLYTPYHLFDVYKRGSVGEVLALAIVPFVLLSIDRMSLFLVSLGVFLLILSHNTMSLFFIPILFMYLFLRKGFVKKVFVFGFLSFSLGVLMSSFFTIPALLELSYTNFSATNISNINVYFSTLNLIGGSSIIVILLSFFIYFWKRKSSLQYKKLFLFFLIISVMSLVLSGRISTSFWGNLPSSLIQFPWRLLSLLILGVAFLSAYIVAFFKNKTFLIVVLLTVLFYSSFKFLKPAEFFDKGDVFYATNEATTTVKDEYMPKWVKIKPIERYSQKIEFLQGQGSIDSLIYNSKKITFAPNVSSEKALVKVGAIYYPGWKAYVSGSEVGLSYRNELGVMEVELPKGKSQVTLIFYETPMRFVADIVSLISLTALLLFSFVKKLNIWD